MSRDIINFLDEMERTRAMRILERPKAWQMDGYRREWNLYVAEWEDDNHDRG